MPKDVPSKYYAVIDGKEGPKIYTNLYEYLNATKYYSVASGKAFSTCQDARIWLDSSVKSRLSASEVGSRMIPASPSGNPWYPRSYISTSPYEKGSKYVDIGIQCKAPPSSPTAPLNVHAIVSPARHQAVANDVNPIQADARLSEEQLIVLNMVKARQNVFFTGPAGTGKSVLLRQIIRHLREHSRRVVAVTAPTGIAGINIGGSTVHSWAGIGLGKETVDDLAESIGGSKKLRERWTETDVLVIDEISMLDGTLFDKLEKIARFVRANERPFGGIQLVLCGDFFQLPPVPDQSHEYRMDSTFAFDARSWPRCISKPFLLTQVFRQKDDIFISLLSSVRYGILTPEHIQLLESLARPIHYNNGIGPTELYPRRREVESCNNNHLSALPDPVVKYKSMDATGWDVKRMPIPRDAAKELLERLVAPPTITLKVGAQVMLIANVQQGRLVNGSIGKVIDFLTHHEAIARHIQIALPQDRRGDADLKKATYRRQGRYRKDEEKIVTPQIQQDPSFRPITDHVFSKNEKWPLVQFTDGSLLLCSAMPFSVLGILGNTEAHRMQVPLILAWALSIHKSQGQTLSRVKIDLSKVFEMGQAYVALSRATSLECLELCNFDPSKIRAHPRVKAWHSECMKRQQSMSIEEEMDSEEAISQFWG